MKKICSQCGKEFELSEGEISFFKNKGLSLPNRCKSCREQNRQNGSKSESASQPYKATAAVSFWQKKPLWFCLIALILIVFAAVYFGGSNIGDTTSESPISSSDIVPDKPADTTSGGSALSSETSEDITSEIKPAAQYSFRNETYLTQHFQKHGGEFDYKTAEEYLAGANRVINDPDSLTKTEKEDGDFVFYLESTNEFVILSTDGYIRTYFRPDDGINYFNRQ